MKFVMVVASVVKHLLWCADLTSIYLINLSNSHAILSWSLCSSYSFNVYEMNDVSFKPLQYYVKVLCEYSMISTIQDVSH